MVDAVVVESPEVATAGTPMGFHDFIHEKIDGVETPVNLSGATVTVTIRRASRPGTVINAALEDLAVSLGAAPTIGETDWVLIDTVSAHLEALTSTDPTKTTQFDAQYKIMPRNYKPYIHRFHVRRAVD